MQVRVVLAPDSMQILAKPDYLGERYGLEVDCSTPNLCIVMTRRRHHLIQV